MAIGTSSQLAELMRQHFDPVFSDLVSRGSWAYRRFTKKPSDSKAIEWKVQADSKNTSVASYAEGAGAPTAVAHKWLDARLTYRFVWGRVKVTGPAQAMAKGPGGFDGFQSLFETELDQTMQDMTDAIDTMLLASSLGSGTDIDGLGIGVLDSATYANIDPNTYTEWKAYRNHNSATPRALTIALMQDVKSTVEDGPRYGSVSVITAPPAQWNAYGNLLTAQRRYTGSEKMDGGFQALEFEGTPVVKVPKHVAGRMYFLSEKQRGSSAANIQYRTLKNFDVQDKSAGAADAMDFEITHYANVQICNRRTNGLLVDLS
jgi:opacity protein-like surface antigen